MGDYSALIGRIAVALIFVINGATKAFNFEPLWHTLNLKGIPMAPAVAILVIIIELGGGLALMLGFNAKFFSMIMTVYMVILTAVFHPIWSDLTLYQDFLKDLAVIGGLLMINSHGAGKSSVDGSHVFDV